MTRHFAFVAHNESPLYGRGTEAEARALLSLMNRGRAINHWAAKELSAANAEKLQLDKSAFSMADEIGRHGSPTVDLLPSGD